MVQIGDPNPDIYGNIFTNLTWKNLTLSLDFKYSLGNDIYNYQRSQLESCLLYTSEFVAEGKRWFDIVRQCEATNANTDVLTNYITLSTTVRNRLKALYSLYNPIYSEEMKVNGVDYGGKLEQNPVWKRYSDN